MLETAKTIISSQKMTRSLSLVHICEADVEAEASGEAEATMKHEACVEARISEKLELYRYTLASFFLRKFCSVLIVCDMRKTLFEISRGETILTQ